MNLRTKNLLVAIFLLWAGTQFSANAQPIKGHSERPALSNRDLAALVRKSLVIIFTQDRAGNAVAQGSGFVFKPGLIATNLHVLKYASQAYVKSASDGVLYKVSSVAGFDLKHDICVLKLSDSSGVPLALSTDEVAVGDDILVAGNPEGLEASFSKGIVSGVRSGSGLIQMDAAISPGSSGGPVVNQRGDVVGLSVSSIVEGQNLNFAVPIRYLRELKLSWNLQVGAIGGLAVTDLERGGFHRLVKSVTESYAGYTFDETRDVYVEGPNEPLTISTYNREGRLENTSGDGSIPSRFEYSGDGLIVRSTMLINKDEYHLEFSPERAVVAMASQTPFDRTEFVGAKGDRNYHEDKYDAYGHKVETTYLTRGVRDVIRFDSLGREVEVLEYRQDKLESATRSAYETNKMGDWIKRHETIWVEREKEEGFTPLMEHYREITYYSDGR